MGCGHICADRRRGHDRGAGGALLGQRRAERNLGAHGPDHRQPDRMPDPHAFQDPIALSGQEPDSVSGQEPDSFSGQEPDSVCEYEPDSVADPVPLAGYLPE